MNFRFFDCALRMFGAPNATALAAQVLRNFLLS